MLCVVNVGIPMCSTNGCTPSNSPFNHNEHRLAVSWWVRPPGVEISRAAGDHAAFI